MRNGFLVFLALAILATTLFTTSPAFAAEDPGYAIIKKYIDPAKLDHPVARAKTLQFTLAAKGAEITNEKAKREAADNDPQVQLDKQKRQLRQATEQGTETLNIANDALRTAKKAEKANENNGWLWFFAPLGFLLGLIAIAMNVFKTRSQQRPAANNNEEPAPAPAPAGGNEEELPAEDDDAPADHTR